MKERQCSCNTHCQFRSAAKCLAVVSMYRNQSRAHNMHSPRSFRILGGGSSGH